MKPHFGQRRGVRRGGSSGGESGERPNFGRTHENFEHTPHRHTTTTTHEVLGKRGSIAGWSMAQNQDMSNKLSQRAAPLAKVFKDDSHKFGQKNGLIRKGAKRRSGPKVVWAKCGQKNQKTWKNKSKKEISLSLSHPKKIKKQNKRRKHPQNQNKKKNISLPRPKNQKNQKNQQENQKIEKCYKKENQIKILLKQEKN